MKRTTKIIFTAIFGVVVISVTFIGFCALRVRKYNAAFPQITEGQNKETVLTLMGNPYEIRSCNFAIVDADRKATNKCFEVLEYQAFTEQWAFAIDKEGSVVEKYYWFLGEYGNKPLDTDQPVRRKEE